MTKEELVMKLKEEGYESELEEGVPYIYGLSYAKAEKVVSSLGYKGTYGIRREPRNEIN